MARPGFRPAEGAWGTIAGYEAKGDIVGQRQFIHTLFGVAA